MKIVYGFEYMSSVFRVEFCNVYIISNEKLGIQ